MGWEGDGLACTDINECMTANGGCDPNAACFNNDGGRNCGCNTGFVGDGLTCRRVWMSRGSAQIRLANVVSGQSNDAVVTAVGTRIYFAPEFGSGGDPSHFLGYFDTSTLSFNTDVLSLPPAAQDDFCGCGYGQVFVGTATDIFMFGNYGQRYNVANGTWSSVNSYASSFLRGEAGGALEASSGTIYMVGGRGPTGTENTVLRFTIAGQGFMQESGSLPLGVERAGAWAPSGGTTLYVAVGRASDNSSQHLISRASPTSAWTSLPDAPASLYDLRGMGDWQGKLWVATQNQLLLFDLTTNQWRSPISIPGGFVVAVAVGSRTFGLFQSDSTLEVMELMAIE